MTEMEVIRKALQNHGRGVITDAELPPSLFPLLDESNLKDFLVMVSPAVLQVLTREALKGPRTEEEWQKMTITSGGSFAGSGSRSEGTAKARYRRGLEALRRHVEAKLYDSNKAVE